MGMSAKAKALLTGEKGAEWNKYQISMQEAYNDFQAEQARTQEKQSSRSGWGKILGGIAFIATAAVLASNPMGWAMLGTGAGMGGASAAGWATALGLTTAAGTAGAMSPQADVFGGTEIKLNKTKEEFLAGVHDPKFGKGRADTEKLAFEGTIQDDITALKAYEEGGLETALFENVGRSSSYLGSAYNV